MARKKFDNKVELFEELKIQLEEMYQQVEAADISLNHLEHDDYTSLIATPFEELLENLEIFVTNLDNGDYELGPDEDDDSNED